VTLPILNLGATRAILSDPFLSKVSIAKASIMDHIRMRDISPLPIRVMDAVNLQSPQTRLRGQGDMLDEMQYLKRGKFLDFFDNNPRLST
jgi:hypothetical protein